MGIRRTIASYWFTKTLICSYLVPISHFISLSGRLPKGAAISCKICKFDKTHAMISNGMFNMSFVLCLYFRWIIGMRGIYLLVFGVVAWNQGLSAQSLILNTCSEIFTNGLLSLSAWRPLWFESPIGELKICFTLIPLRCIMQQCSDNAFNIWYIKQWCNIRSYLNRMKNIKALHLFFSEIYELVSSNEVLFESFAFIGIESSFNQMSKVLK